MSAMIKVRLCETNDLPLLRLNEPHPSARLAEKHLALQERGDYYFAVAHSGSRPLGTCVLDVRDPLSPELKNLWVYPEARRMGAGRALTRYLEELATDLGYEEVFFGVDPDNAEAIPMYVSLDYSPTGNHRTANYTWVDKAGNTHERSQLDAVYRKSLLALLLLKCS